MLQSRATGARRISVRGPITYDRFREIMEGEGAFVYAGMVRVRRPARPPIKEETKATIRVLPDPEFRSPEPPRTCLKCGQRCEARGIVGQGVLTDAVRRVARRLECEDVPLPTHRRQQLGRRPTCIARPRARRSTAHSTRRSRRSRTGSTTASKRTAIWRCCGLLRGSGAGVDIVSAGELFRARRLASAADDVVFSGVGKTARRDPSRRSRAGVRLINVESEAELHVIDAVAAANGRHGARRASRQPGSRSCEPARVHSHRGAGHKFGIAYDDARGVARSTRALPSTAAAGARHASRLADRGHGAVLRRESTACRRYMIELVPTGARDLTYLDVGGGLAVAYDDETPTDIRCSSPASSLRLVRATGLTLLVEPGRFLVGNAGLLLTRVCTASRQAARPMSLPTPG